MKLFLRELEKNPKVYTIGANFFRDCIKDSILLKKKIEKILVATETNKHRFPCRKSPNERSNQH
jgi:hypothetical protein